MAPSMHDQVNRSHSKFTKMHVRCVLAYKNTCRASHKILNILVLAYQLEEFLVLLVNINST